MVFNLTDLTKDIFTAVKFSQAIENNRIANISSFIQTPQWYRLNVHLSPGLDNQGSTVCVLHYKDRKCAGNQNSSLHIEISMGKTSNLQQMEEFRVFLVYKTCAEDEKADVHMATGHSRNAMQYGGTLV